ncbi:MULTISPECIES: helix-turn-helix domain-containing protein [Halobacterium]|uniref:HTH domain protein n=2 Tax=Halobacterium salinarum TaxID=2242 RepID=B0RA11_HALS3|nr:MULTISPECIES: helix-turn-helix domain-containing protein [Halobacterium]MBB6090869.1 ribosomal protein S27E [Halobacterium salinarum]MDL0137914.1 helix-turn-helix domain-containing protein [Halobacterium salinarum]QRY21511.1 helix-turn-helix transcriptional regulator [Halobacterium sp. GSL-19]QRY26108.1 helix-turn-helix domain-containing protein [Halobacterium sp. BOL4-2]UEB93151.1 helix-turn-helix domain-containing protein [Halobacterium salinarum NRC-34001]
MDGASTEAISPEDAFALLGHDIRISIVQALWELDNEPASFSELRDTAAITDSGQFNYHLGELRGVFVRETEDGYTLNYAGRSVVGAILDGTYTKQRRVPEYGAGFRCAVCDTELTASYSDSAFRITCTECDYLISRVDLPPGAVDDRDESALVSTASYWIQAKFFLITNGVCPNCAGPMEHSWRTDVAYENHEFVLQADCVDCMNTATATGMWAYANHPAVVSFFYEHDINLHENWWHSQLLIGGGAARIRSRDPWRGAVSYAVDGEVLALVVDESGQVVAEERR